jgi:hypothetical protein
MADVSVQYDPSAPGAKKLAQLQSYIQAARALAADIKGTVDFQSSHPTYTTAEAHYGLPASSGEAFYNRISGALTAIESNQINEVSYIYVPSS